MPLDALLLGTHAVVTIVLAGMVWIVQLVVYPAFRTVGPTEAWSTYHRRHTAAMARVVALPWALQGGVLAVLLVRRPSRLLLAGALAATTVLVTVAVSVPLHGRLARGYDAAAARRLVRTNWLRTAAWTGGAACAVGLAARGAS